MKRSAIQQREVWCLLGLPFDAISLQGSVEYCRQSIETRDKCFLSTPNLNFAISTQSDNDFFQSVLDSDLSVADGMPLIWVAKLLGIPISERVAGSTLFEEISSQKHIAKKIKVFFFGGQDGVAEQAHQKLIKKSKSMMSCGFYAPGFVSVDEMSTLKIIDHINETNPDFIVVALGARKGQEWIQRNRKKLDAPIISHLGAVINFVAGNIERAPILWQRLGMEWLWRIRQEPTLWKRYFFDGLAFARLLLMNVFPLAVYDRILRKSPSYKEPYKIASIFEDNECLKLSGSIHHLVMDKFKQDLADVLAGAKGEVVFDCIELKYIDSAFIATTLLFQRYLEEQDRTLVLKNISPRISKILRMSSVIKRFRLI